MVTEPALFDTNILISALLRQNGPATAALLAAQPAGLAISVISWMEVMVGTKSAKEQETRRFLARFQIFGVTPEVMERSVLLRQSTRLKLPDAIIYATALTSGRTLVTADRGDFPFGTPGVRILDLVQ